MTISEEPGKPAEPGEQNDQGAVQLEPSAIAIEIAPPHESKSEGENENERLLLFSDGIIAFTITLAAISIRLPAGKDYTNLSTFLTDLGPYLLTYVIGFVIVGSY